MKSTPAVFTGNSGPEFSSNLFVWAALGSMVASATLKCLGKKQSARFVGQCATPFLLLGVYNKFTQKEKPDPQITTLWSE